jgi:hypothetical protein
MNTQSKMMTLSFDEMVAMKAVMRTEDKVNNTITATFLWLDNATIKTSCEGWSEEVKGAWIEWIGDVMHDCNDKSEMPNAMRRATDGATIIEK